MREETNCALNNESIEKKKMNSKNKKERERERNKTNG